MSVELAVTRVGGDGDGVAEAADGSPAYIPFTLPGEVVSAGLSGSRGVLDAVLRPSPERVEPPCPHFGVCGGCALQHWAAAPTAAWKAGQVAAALRRAGFPNADVTPPVLAASHTRRRMDLAIRRRPDGVTVGLHAAATRGAEILDLRVCLVLHPALFALVEPLRHLLPTLRAFRRDGSAVANLLDSGPDLLLRLDGTPDSGDRASLTAFARAHDLPRITTAPLRGGVPEIACLLRPPTHTQSGMVVTPPPAAFLQATADGEAAIVAALLAGLPPKLPTRATVVELFAGVGTLTVALASRARVLAFEGDAGAHAALATAARQPPWAGRIIATARDLARQPLRSAELNRAAAIVLDPPHAGAAAQMPAIAASGVTRVVYVSCNPMTLGRDAASLRAAGYRLVSATAIDQFPWSARIESVSVFARQV